MATQLSRETLQITETPITDNRFYTTDPNPIISRISHHEYELNLSESLTFLYNLLYDPQSLLTKSDILSILNCLKYREDNLPLLITESDKWCDIQGIKWPTGLSTKFYVDRLRVGQHNWFYNIPESRTRAFEELSIRSTGLNTEFYKFHRFFSKLKLHITHFQLRNLVCCGDNILNGVYYPLSYYHDFNLQTVNLGSENELEQVYSYFKVNRLRNDSRELMSLDCLVDSRTLLKNSNNRISTMSCTNNYLACGTFEGGYILVDVSKDETIGEYHLTSNADGITNHITIDEFSNELIISSNDKSLRLVNMLRPEISTLMNSEFAVNCTAINSKTPHEVFITGDSTYSYIIDSRMRNLDTSMSLKFKGHTDYGFSCDWSPKDENLLITGNQDGLVKLWDRRNADKLIHTWSGSLGSKISEAGKNIYGGAKSESAFLGGPVRNCKFGYNGEYVAWAESLDHIGIIQLDDLKNSVETSVPRVQSIDFIGKCTGISFAPIENGYGEQMIVGVNDCPLGGILSYKLELRGKSLDFDFAF